MLAKWYKKEMSHKYVQTEEMNDGGVAESKELGISFVGSEFIMVYHEASKLSQRRTHFVSELFYSSGTMTS